MVYFRFMVWILNKSLGEQTVQRNFLSMQRHGIIAVFHKRRFNNLICKFIPHNARF